eukprot:g20760.t1
MFVDATNGSLMNTSGQLPIARTVAASSAFFGSAIDSVLLSEISAQLSADVAVWVGETGFEAAEHIREELQSHVDSQAISQLAQIAFHALLDGGFTDGTGVAQAVAAGSSEVVAVLNSFSSNQPEYVAQLFPGGTVIKPGVPKELFPVFQSPNASTVQASFEHFETLQIAAGSMYLKVLAIGTIDAVTADNAFFGITRGRAIKIQVINICSELMHALMGRWRASRSLASRPYGFKKRSAPSARAWRKVKERGTSSLRRRPPCRITSDRYLSEESHKQNLDILSNLERSEKQVEALRKQERECYGEIAKLQHQLLTCKAQLNAERLKSTNLVPREEHEALKEELKAARHRCLELEEMQASKEKDSFPTACASPTSSGIEGRPLTPRPIWMSCRGVLDPESLRTMQQSDFLQDLVMRIMQSSRILMAAYGLQTASQKSTVLPAITRHPFTMPLVPETGSSIDRQKTPQAGNPGSAVT